MSDLDYEGLDNWATERSVLNSEEKTISEGRDQLRLQFEQLLDTLSHSRPVTGRELKQALETLERYLRRERVLQFATLATEIQSLQAPKPDETSQFPPPEAPGGDEGSAD